MVTSLSVLSASSKEKAAVLSSWVPFFAPFPAYLWQEHGEPRLSVAKRGRVVLLLAFPAPLLHVPAACPVLCLEAVGSLRELIQLNNTAKLGELSVESAK